MASRAAPTAKNARIMGGVLLDPHGLGWVQEVSGPVSEGEAQCDAGFESTAANEFISKCDAGDATAGP